MTKIKGIASLSKSVTAMSLQVLLVSSGNLCAYKMSLKSNVKEDNGAKSVLRTPELQNQILIRYNFFFFIYFTFTFFFLFPLLHPGKYKKLTNINQF